MWNKAVAAVHRIWYCCWKGLLQQLFCNYMSGWWFFGLYMFQNVYDKVVRCSLNSIISIPNTSRGWYSMVGLEISQVVGQKSTTSVLLMVLSSLLIVKLTIGSLARVMNFNTIFNMRKTKLMIINTGAHIQLQNLSQLDLISTSFKKMEVVNNFVSLDQPSVTWDPNCWFADILYLNIYTI